MNQSWHASWCVSHRGYQQRALIPTENTTRNLHFNSTVHQDSNIPPERFYSIGYQDPSLFSKRPPNGFSLFEVLVSLLLLTSISLAVLKQQWKSNQFLTSFIHNIDYLLETDNQCESLQPTH